MFGKDLLRNLSYKGTNDSGVKRSHFKGASKGRKNLNDNGFYEDDAASSTVLVG